MEVRCLIFQKEYITTFLDKHKALEERNFEKYFVNQKIKCLLVSVNIFFDTNISTICLWIY